MATTLVSELADVRKKISAAFDASQSDAATSPVTVAVIREFLSKADKAVGAADHDAVVELEQAGDSAKAAAEADAIMPEGSRQLVLDAHLAICMLKARRNKDPG